MNRSAVSLTLPTNTLRRVDDLARKRNLPRSYLVQELLERLLQPVPPSPHAMSHADAPTGAERPGV